MRLPFADLLGRARCSRIWGPRGRQDRALQHLHSSTASCGGTGTSSPCTCETLGLIPPLGTAVLPLPPQLWEGSSPGSFPGSQGSLLLSSSLPELEMEKVPGEKLRFVWERSLLAGLTTPWNQKEASCELQKGLDEIHSSSEQ